jgi:hypothetical protein
MMEQQTSATGSSEALNPGQQVYLRKYASEFMLELNRSVRAALKPWGRE